MDQVIEDQLLKLLQTVSPNERNKNVALERQTERLLKALDFLKAIVANSELKRGQKP